MLYKKSFGYRKIHYLILLILTLSLSSCKKTINHEESKSGIPVSIIPVTKGTIEASTQYTGVAKPKKIVYVTALIPGKVSSVFFETGDRVKKGDLLFTVDSSELESNISILKEQLKVAKANVDLAKTGVVATMGSNYESQKIQLESALESAENNFVAMKNAFDYSTFLFEINKIDSERYLEVKNQYKQAENALQTASRAYDLYINHLSEDAVNISNMQLQQAEASYEALKLQLESAKEKLNYIKIRSPIDGVIANKDIIEGAMISNVSVPYIIVDTDTVQISISVTEQIINKIGKGDNIIISIPSAGQKNFVGKVNTISPAIDQKSFTYNVLIDLPNKDNLIKPGMTAKASILTEKRENVILVPLDSVISKDNEKYVFVVENDQAVKKTVITGLTSNNQIEIRKGLECGELIVINGQHLLSDNISVEIVGEGLK
ncbi:MAG: efflux RND transporter periplasmic adaptor subunit [Acetivibrionales bacterium]|jgi:RND family efflux transporter MFP subunit|nr:efflux RND transporter periplasmic adaptor subunit [Clostridiaceae bacterium]